MSNLPLTKLELVETSYLMYLPDAETDYIQQKITQDKRPYEYAMLRDMAAHLSKKDIFVDIGANIGNHTLYLAALTGCTVHAFEPNSHLVDALKHSVIANQLQKKVTVHQMGLGAAPAVAKFAHLDPTNLGAQSLALGEGDIEVRTLDEFALSKAVKVIKIDVEGMEIGVLQGASKTIAKCRPIVYVECQHLAEFGPISQFFAEQNYAYLNTYNATPTHLFIPQEQLNIKQEFRSLAERCVGQAYDYKDKFSELTQKLKLANEKYRNATTEIETAKIKLAEQAQQVAIQQTQQADLAQSQLQLKTLEGRLVEANEKYRLSCEQNDQLKEKKQQLTEQLQEKQQLWLAANQKYKDATEQIAQFKLQLQQVKSQQQLPEALPEVAQLYQQVLAIDSALPQGLTTAAEQLAVVEQFIRNRQQQHIVLQQAAEQAEAERFKLTQQQTELQQQLAEQQQALALAAQELAAATLQQQADARLLETVQQQAAVAHEQLTKNSAELSKVVQQQQHDTQQLAVVRQQYADTTQRLEKREQELAVVTKQQQSDAKQLAVVSQQYNDAIKLHHKLETELAAAQIQQQATNEQIQRDGKEITLLTQQFASATQQLAKYETELSAARQQQIVATEQQQRNGTEIALLTQQYATAAKQIVKYETELASAVQQQALANEQQQLDQSKIASLTQQCVESTARLSLLEKNLADSQLALTSTQQQVKLLKEQLTKQQVEFTEQLTAVQQLQSQTANQLTQAQQSQAQTVSELARAKQLQVQTDSELTQAQLLQAKTASDLAQAQQLQVQTESELTQAQQLQAKTENKLAQAQQLQAQFESELSKAEQALLDAALEQQQIAQQLLSLQQELAESRSDAGQLAEDLAQTNDELTQTIRLRADAQLHVQQTQALIQQQNDQLAQLLAETAAQQQQLHTLQQQSLQLQQREQAQAELSERQQQQLATACAENIQLQQALQQQAAQAATEIAALSQQIALSQELDDVKYRTAVLSPQYQQLTEQFRQQNSTLATLKAQLNELQQAFDKNHQHLKNARKQLEQKQQLEMQCSELQQQLDRRIEQESQWKLRHVDDRSELDLVKAQFKASQKRGISQEPAQLPKPLQPLFQQILRQQQVLAQIKHSKVACIMDEFTFGSYAPEANLLQLTPQFWQRELAGFQPDVLFIESAWRGKHEIWGNKVGHKAQELVAIVEWCKQRHIPTLFWNKEDPVHFETFISTAKLFDFVFTTDFDCIHRYKAALEHDQVYLLPFAAQPGVNNPIELYQRKDAFSFAGAYYVRYPDRTRDLDDFLQHLPAYKAVEIYDRNYGKNDANYMFPESYQPFIVGNLPYDQIDKAYKGYRYAINLNSIKHSQSMFARRAYELLASNTLTVSNYSRGIELMFGDLVLNSDSGQQIVDRLQQIEQDPVYCQKFQLTALRKVLQHHTYQDRLGYILSKTSGLPAEPLLPTIVVAAYASNVDRASRLLQNFQQQRYSHKQLLLVVADHIELPENLLEDVTLLPVEQVKSLSFKQLFPAGSWFGFMVADDYYGPNYLTDLALATRYSPAPLIGKVAHYRYVSADEIRLNQPKKSYSLSEKMEARSGIFRTDLYPTQKMYDWLRKAYQLELQQPQVLAIDPFNYCKALPLDVDATQVQPLVDDQLSIAVGMAYPNLQQLAEQVRPQAEVQLDLPALSAVDLQQLFALNAKKGKVQLDFQANFIEVVSDLADGKHEYLYADRLLTVNELAVAQDGQLHFFLEATTGMNLQVLVVFLNQDKGKISHQIRYANKNNSIEIPSDCQFIQLALRFYASGVCSIKRLVLQHLEIEPQLLLPQSDYLLLTNHYPSYQDLYRNGFVHTRVKAYRERGVVVDVFRLRKDEPVSWHEYQSIQVCTASQQALRKALASGRYKHVLVHFLDTDMWDVLKDFIADIRVTVWVHGAEIQPWWRREYNYSTEIELNAAKIVSQQRMNFWKSVLIPYPSNMHLVFVSAYFCNEVQEDLAIEFQSSNYSVVHNPIDTSLFDYQPKSAEQRCKILSIRPYASAKYANDLSAKAILELSKEEFFSELEFMMIGDGVLFDETLLPLRDFPNVHIEKGFKSQTEIAALHKQYGLFLCPTRMDAQGVSRDEAMASGLVPVTNAVTAIPEFTDDSCALLAPGEDAQAMADLIKSMYFSPEDFQVKSSNAVNRVKCQTDKKIILDKEIQLITVENK